MSDRAPGTNVGEAAGAATRRPDDAMRIGVLGTGAVGQLLGTKLVALGHTVCMGSRDAANPKAAAWASKAGAGGRHGAFRDAAAFGDLVVNATKGTASLEALAAAGAENLRGKVLIDVGNAVQASPGGPALRWANTDSLAEQIQRAYPEAKVVKTLNTMNVAVMAEPAAFPHTNVFVNGNDEPAKEQVKRLLQAFGWERERIIDLGDITAARGAEGYMLLFFRLVQRLGTPAFNIAVVTR